MLPAIIIDNDGESPEFWVQLGGDPSDVKTAKLGGSDLLVKARKPVLFRASMEGRKHKKCEFERIGAGRALKLKMLDTNHVFILDTATYIFCWVGAKASKAERREAMVHAEHYLAHHDDSSCPDTPVMRVYESCGRLPNGLQRCLLLCG